MSEPASPPRRSQRPGGRTLAHTQRIYEAVLMVLQRDGYAMLSFQAVAEAAGVARSTLYRRWPARAEMVLDAVGDSTRRAIPTPDRGGLRGDLRAVLEAVDAYIRSPLGAAALTASIEIGEPSAGPDRADRWRLRLADLQPIFDRAADRGEIAADFDREAAFSMIAGALYFRRLVAGQPAGDAWIERILDLASRMASG